MKKSVVAIYESHEKAIGAVKYLVKHGISEEELSIVGQGELVEDHIHLVPVKKAKTATIFIGVGVGAALGLLIGLGVLPLPMRITGEGGGIGMLAGVVVGGVFGALASMVFSMVVRKDDLVVMQKHIDKGKYMLVVKGSMEDIETSKKLLHTENLHEEIIDIPG